MGSAFTSFELRASNMSGRLDRSLRASARGFSKAGDPSAWTDRVRSASVRPGRAGGLSIMLLGVKPVRAKFHHQHSSWNTC